MFFLYLRTRNARPTHHRPDTGCRTNVDVVSEFVTLRKRGVNFVGLCPFHDDKTPSFYVSPAKDYCKWTSPVENGGNAVHFVMEHEQMTYPEALRWLAKKYNIEIKETRIDR